MEAIKVQNLSVGYEDRTVAEQISFSLNMGDYLCIIGENGSGKSTLLKTLLQLQEPLRGEIVYGSDIRRNELGYLPQQTDIQRDFPASVREVVLSGCLSRCGWRPFYNRDEKARAADNLARMGMGDFSDRCYRELSGGQQQRVLLARALCAADQVLFLDEPVTGLDPSATEDMYELIRQLNAEGLTIIMVSHDVAASLEDASHVLYMGEQVFFGTKDEYLLREKAQALSGNGGDDI